MPRPIWTGSISFGLVNVPVRVFSATESHRVAFHEFEEGTSARIRNRRVAEGSSREVPWEKIQKGFEVDKDRFVVLTDEELAAAAPERTHAIDIEQFVRLAEIDPVSWDQGYYLAPDGPSAAKAYVLLRDAMREDERVAIGRFVMRTKEYVACIRPLEDALALHTMFYPDEVRRVGEVVKIAGRASADARELALARQLITSLSSPWRPEHYEDTYRRRVLALVKKKARGETISVAEAQPATPRIVDLMDALNATLAERGPKGRAAPRHAHPPRSEPRTTRAKSTRTPARRVAKQGGHR